MPPPLCLTTPNTVARPEPGAAAAGLGGEERLEQVLGGPPRPCRSPVSLTASSTCGPGATSPWVATCSSSSVDVGGLDRQRAAVGHRVAGVGGEVEDHPLDLRAVGLDGREVGREPDADADVVADDPLQHRLHPGDDLVEVDGRCGCSTCRRLNASSWRVSARGLLGRARDLRRAPRAAVAVARQDRRRSREITVSRLLKSCATPPASRPIASIFSASASRSLQPPALGDVVGDARARRAAPRTSIRPARDLDVDERAVAAAGAARSRAGRAATRRRAMSASIAATSSGGRISVIRIVRNSLAASSRSGGPPRR